MVKNEIITELYEELGLSTPSWIPEEYESAINHFANTFSGRNQLPVKNGDNEYMYPINKELVRNRVTNQLLKALINGEEVPETDRGVESLLTKDPKYLIMLNGTEERALCKAMQQSLEISNPCKQELVRDALADVAVTFLSPRIKFIYRKFEKAVGACNAYEDVVQEMILAMFKMLEDFNFERTTAGITKDFLNARMFRAINIALAANRSASMAQETWNKVSRFVNHPEDHVLSREEVKKKYRCSAGLVEIMFTFAGSGSLEVSLDYVPSESQNSYDANYTSFGDMIPAKDFKNEEIELDMTLKNILPELQYKVVKLKMKGYSHQVIAEKLGLDSKRKSQYIFICARKTIEREFNIDASQYSKGRSRYLKQLRKTSLLDEEDDEFEMM